MIPESTTSACLHQGREVHVVFGASTLKKRAYPEHIGSHMHTYKYAASVHPQNQLCEHIEATELKSVGLGFILQSQRQKAKATMMYKIHHHLIGIQAQTLLIPRVTITRGHNLPLLPTDKM